MAQIESGLGNTYPVYSKINARLSLADTVVDAFDLGPDSESLFTDAALTASESHPYRSSLGSTVIYRPLARNDLKFHFFVITSFARLSVGFGRTVPQSPRTLVHEA